MPLNLSDHLQELFGFLGFFPTPTGTPPQDLSSSVSAYSTQLFDKEEMELRTRRWTLPFLLSFLEVAAPSSARSLPSTAAMVVMAPRCFP